MMKEISKNVKSFFLCQRHNYHINSPSNFYLQVCIRAQAYCKIKYQVTKTEYKHIFCIREKTKNSHFFKHLSSHTCHHILLLFFLSIFFFLSFLLNIWCNIMFVHLIQYNVCMCINFYIHISNI